MSRLIFTRESDKSGFTMVEVMVSIAVLTMVLVAFLQVLMSVHHANAAITTSITASSAIRSQADEAMAAASENVKLFNNYARSLVNYYGTQVASIDSISGDDALPIRPNGVAIPKVALEDGNRVLVYRFVVPAPGSFSRSVVVSGGSAQQVGEVIPYDNGLGEMRIYLDESAVPLQGPLSSREPLLDTWNNEAVWNTIGSNKGDGEDGNLVSDSAISFSGRADFVNPPRRLNRVFIDIVVTYYRDATHTHEVVADSRRIVITGSLDTRHLFG